VKIRKKHNQRKASATVEMAVVTPLLLAMLFGIIEYGWVFSIKQAMTTAVRDGARVAALPGSTDTDIEERVAQALAPVGLGETEYTLNLTRAVPDDPTEVVELVVPYENFTLIGSFFGSTDFNFTAKCSMRKEAMD
jgi:hypothetical protein